MSLMRKKKSVSLITRLTCHWFGHEWYPSIKNKGLYRCNRCYMVGSD